MKKIIFNIFLFQLFLLLLYVPFPSSVIAQVGIIKSHAISLYGDVKYGPSFKYFDYVNPNALKGGTVRLASLGTFDSLNPFILKGTTASGLALIFDTLMTESYDEPFTMYGLLAESIEVPSDRSWVAFNLRPEARWHNGTPITADDVVFSFEILTSKGHPFYRSYYYDVLRVEKLNNHKVKFYFREGSNPELPLIIGQLPVISRNYYKTNPFDETTLEPPLGNGPYRIKDVKPGRSITYQRVENYWGKDLPVNRGRYNFDEIRYEYYRDHTVALEAFKAGEYDFRLENIARVWATAYEGTAFDKKLIIKEELPDETPTGMQAFVFNTRKSIFQDRRVRLALTYAFDFEWMNKTIFYNAYTRTRSYFSNSELASSGLPGPEELELLEPYRNQLPPEVFNKEYKPPETDGSGNIRENLRKALNLLNEAGWTLKGGNLINEKTAQVFEFELLLVDPAMEKVAIPFSQNLEKLGIKMHIRVVDSSQYINRLDNFDYDMVVTTWLQSLSPGNEQRDFWSTEAAKTPGSRNLAGIQDPVVDALIEKVIRAKDRKSLVAACKALDRVLLWGHYVIPHWHITTYRIAYWNRFSRPDIKPKYALGFIDIWWIDPDKDRNLSKR